MHSSSSELEKAKSRKRGPNVLNDDLLDETSEPVKKKRKKQLGLKNFFWPRGKNVFKF